MGGARISSSPLRALRPPASLTLAGEQGPRDHPPGGIRQGGLGRSSEAGAPPSPRSSHTRKFPVDVRLPCVSLWCYALTKTPPIRVLLQIARMIADPTSTIAPKEIDLTQSTSESGTVENTEPPKLTMSTWSTMVAPPRAGREHREALPLQVGPEEVSDLGLVLYHQHRYGHSSPPTRHSRRMGPVGERMRSSGGREGRP